MLGSLLDGRRQGDTAFAARFAQRQRLDETRAAKGQRAGLVEDEMRCPRQRLDGMSAPFSYSIYELNLSDLVFYFYHDNFIMTKFKS